MIGPNYADQQPPSDYPVAPPRLPTPPVGLMLYDPGYIPGGRLPVPPIDRPERWPRDDKGHCIRLYGICQDYGWTGSCQTCLDRCKAEGEWPFHLCDGPNQCKR